MTSPLSEMFDTMYSDLNGEQRAAMQLLHSPRNVFVTGGAGTGKSHLIKNYLRGTDSKTIPVLASTGAAAVLIGGRTFHSFFGLGIMEGDEDQIIDRALHDRRVVKRLREANAIVIDEVSMIPGKALALAEIIASNARTGDEAWGGLKIIAVGDFAQLPPISRYSKQKDWAFLNPVWSRTNFENIYLTQMMRSGEDANFCGILDEVRRGIFPERLRELIEFQSGYQDTDDFGGSVLFARKADVERINTKKLMELQDELHVFPTTYTGASRSVKTIKNNAPIPEILKLKKGAFVMIRQNDPRMRWCNGTLGHVMQIKSDTIKLKLLSGTKVELAQSSFGMLDAEGKEVAAAKNFPLSLAWAITIHKSQGATLDKAVVSLKGLWEPGQAYVALSRVRSSQDLMISSWDEKSIIADPQVQNFHSYLQSGI